MNPNFLDFEQPIADLQAKIEELRLVGSDNSLNISDEIARLQDKSNSLTESIFGSLSSWQIAQLARHPRRPYTLDYLQHIFTEFDELHGDRHFSDDAALVGGVARLDGEPVMVIGHQKGREVREIRRRSQLARQFSGAADVELARVEPGQQSLLRQRVGAAVGHEAAMPRGSAEGGRG